MYYQRVDFFRILLSISSCIVNIIKFCYEWKENVIRGIIGRFWKQLNLVVVIGIFIGKFWLQNGRGRGLSIKGMEKWMENKEFKK